MTSKYLLRIFSIIESCICHLSILIYRDLLQKKNRSAIQPITISDTDATFVRGESSSSIGETEAFRG